MGKTATNPFEDSEGEYLVLRNAAGEFSLWPGTITVPAGWQSVFGPASRPACAEQIERNWTGLSVMATTVEPGELLS